MVIKKRIAVYTCVTNGYDELMEPLDFEDDVDYLYFSDKPLPERSAWKCVTLPYDFKNGQLNNRYVKMHPHLLLPGHDITVYVDGNIKIVSSVSELVEKSMNRASIALYKHSFRNCIYKEAEECAAIGHDWRWRISAQMKRYRREGFPVGWGLFEGNVIIRDNRSKEMVRLMELWWKEFCRYVRRDQLSLTYLAWKNSVPIYCLGPSDPRGAQTIFGLHKIHEMNSLAIRLRRFVNRWLRNLGLFEIPDAD